MPAYPTHTFFSHLVLQGLLDTGNPLAGVALRHAALFRIAGIAGCDIQCMPYQICRNCQAPYRHDQGKSKTCLVCRKEALEDFSFQTADGRQFTRRDIERDFYGHTHLVLYRSYRGYGVPKSQPAGPPSQPFPNQVIRHLANCLRDAKRTASPGKIDEYLAFTLGWFSHVVSDALFKGVYPDAVRINFFGDQYSMKMLPAAETLTMTDLSYDFGIRWASWHDQLDDQQTDGGALRHLAMGDSPERYDPQYWTAEFGRPDPSFGAVLEALPPINRKWFRRMYVQPDYSAASPLLDAAPLSTRAAWLFGEPALDLGELRRYSLNTGWHTAFIKGVSIYLRALAEAWKTIDGELDAFTSVRPPLALGIPSWGLWERVVGEACGRPVPDEKSWGGSLQIDPRAADWLRSARDRYISINEGREANEEQRKLKAFLRSKSNLRFRPGASTGIVVGPPAFNPAALEFVCGEDALRLKYDHGLAGMVRVSPSGNKLLISGLSDFGDLRLTQWVQEQIKNPRWSRAMRAGTRRKTPATMQRQK